jgi:hypothetical protein
MATIVESVKCRRDPGFRSRKIESSQGEGPRVGCSNSLSHEERRQPLDPSQGRTIGSGTPSPIVHLGVQMLRGVTFNCRSREVTRAEACMDMWQSRKVVPA